MSIKQRNINKPTKKQISEQAHRQTETQKNTKHRQTDKDTHRWLEPKCSKLLFKMFKAKKHYKMWQKCQ